MALGGNIKRIRKLKKITVAELAKKTGVKPESIYAWERGDYNPNEENLQSVSKVLEVPVKDFYDENHASVQNESDNTKKIMGDPEVYRTIVEGKTEYVLVPRIILKDAKLMSMEQIANDRRVMDMILSQNEKLIAKITASETKLPSIEEGKNNP